jgi:hypothetical protein
VHSRLKPKIRPAAVSHDTIRARGSTCDIFAGTNHSPVAAISERIHGPPPVVGVALVAHEPDVVAPLPCGSCDPTIEYVSVVNVRMVKGYLRTVGNMVALICQ